MSSNLLRIFLLQMIASRRILRRMKPTTFNHDHLQTLRKSAGFTQEALIEELNKRHVEVTLRTLVYWEAGEYYPDADTLAVLADIFGVSVQAFYTNGK